MKNVTIICFLCICATAGCIDWSSFETEYEDVSVKWSYNPVSILVFGFVPEPYIAIDDERFFGYTLKVGSRKTSYGSTRVAYRNVIMPKDVYKELKPTFGELWTGWGDITARQLEFTNEYSKTHIGSQLTDFFDDTGWYNTEAISRSQGRRTSAGLWTAVDISFRICGIGMGAIGGIAYLQGSGSGLDSEGATTLMAAGGGMIVAGNLIDFMIKKFRARDYRRVAEELKTP